MDTALPESATNGEKMAKKLRIECKKAATLDV